MRVAIVGSRGWADKMPIALAMGREFTEAWDRGERVTYVSGGARSGADAICKELCEANNHDYVEYPADWDTHGRSAGYRRNVTIVENSDKVIAFWDGESPGTKQVIDLALKHKKHLEVIFPEASHE